ncbi:MAG: ECF transporter S component [Lachnospiraceae bacterium]|nr:ECF transporter S component [Lachnospiraceae bacterium]
MSDNTVKNSSAKPAQGKHRNVHKLVQVAMLSAVATVLMLIEFPLPFIAPTFYEIDLSEVPVLIAGFAMGPVAGIVTEFLKVLLHVLIKGTSTAFVGDFANFIIGCAFVVPAALIYKHHKSKHSALIGMIAGTVIMAVVGVLMNAYVLLPAYGKAFNMPIEAFIEMGAAIHPAVNSVMLFCILLVAPFNLIKGAVDTLITMLLYKKISILLKSFWNR